jgi:methylenetetrahydrofolate reductase (NADPH)
VHNDFHATRGIFPIFDGLEVKDMDKPLHKPSADLPNANGSEAVNGTNGVNGTHKDESPGLIETAKAAAVEVTNGIKGLAVSN